MIARGRQITNHKPVGERWVAVHRVFQSIVLTARVFAYYIIRIWKAIAVAVLQLLKRTRTTLVYFCGKVTLGMGVSSCRGRCQSGCDAFQLVDRLLYMETLDESVALWTG